MRNRFLSFVILMILGGFSCASHPADLEVVNYDIAANEVQVDGYLIDVRLVKKNQEVFPQNDNYVFTDKNVEAIGGMMHYAVSLMEYAGTTSKTA